MGADYEYGMQSPPSREVEAAWKLHRYNFRGMTVMNPRLLLGKIIPNKKKILSQERTMTHN